MNPRSLLFTKQQVGELTGLGGDTLNYWMREGLLRPAEGGTGKGSHRRFPFSEINLAAILQEIQRFGANLASLKALCAVLRESEAWALNLPIEHDPNRSPYDNPRLLSLVQENRRQFEKLGFCLWTAADFPGRPIEDHSPLSNTPRVRLTWDEMVCLMKGPGFYQSELGAHFSDSHFKVAAEVSPQEVERHGLVLRTFRAIPDEAPTSNFPVYFARQDSGEWALAAIPAEASKLGLSWLAIDVKRLIYRLWNR